MTEIVSVVIPVYNREEWLGNAIDSLLQQECGLTHIQVVLVDDGSTDRSGRICDEYAQRYPRHVVTTHQDNAGVASAFNVGLDMATGDIIGFLGSDDYLSPDTIGAVLAFFSQYGNEVDLAAIKIEMTGSRSGPHWNNRGRFDRTGVINVEASWNMKQVHSGGVFVKAATFDDADLRFDEMLFISEDLTLITQIVMRRMAYGVISGPTYFNRRYTVGSDSQVSSSHQRRDFFDLVLDHAYERLLDDAKRIFGTVPLYVQAVVAYDLVFRFHGVVEVLDSRELELYRKRIASLLRRISVLVIMSAKTVIEERINMLDLREGGALDEHLRIAGGLAVLEGVRIYSFDPAKSARHRPPRCEILSFDVVGNSVSVIGALKALQLSSDIEFGISVGTRFYPVKIDSRAAQSTRYLSHSFKSGMLFRSVVPFHPGATLSIVARITQRKGGFADFPLVVYAGRSSGIAGSPTVPYFRRKGLDVFRQADDYRLEWRRLRGAREVLGSELGFLRRARASGAEWPEIRTRLRALRAQRGKDYEQIWLIADHRSEAGDNGEAIFRHLCAHPELGIYPVMVLSSTATVHRELSVLGEVVEPGSRRFFDRYFQADVVLNSAADEYMINPLGALSAYVRDLIPPISVFLQHGVTKDDQSDWLNFPRKGFDVFLVSSPLERDAILDGTYGYAPDQVALTGLPRMDVRNSSPEGLVLIAPTWRRELAGELNIETGRAKARDDFDQSEYFQRWQEVISHPRLNAYLEARGMRAALAMHPSHSAEIGKFFPGRRVDVLSYPFDYQELFSRLDILVTDYSSVAFDVAYLRKPVVYLQGDRKQFYANHLYRQGYYSYDEDGFGPVVEGIEALVDEVIAALGLNGRMMPEYEARAERFFAFQGGGNCQRVVDAVAATQERKGLRSPCGVTTSSASECEDAPGTLSR